MGHRNDRRCHVVVSDDGDANGIASLPRISPVPGPWDDCFLAGGTMSLEQGHQHLHLRADVSHWVV
jgi:aldose 1-epimerase